MGFESYTASRADRTKNRSTRSMLRETIDAPRHAIQAPTEWFARDGSTDSRPFPPRPGPRRYRAPEAPP